MKQGNRKKKYISFYLKRLVIFFVIAALIAGYRLNRQWEDVKRAVRNAPSWLDRAGSSGDYSQETLDRIETDADIPLRLALLTRDSFGGIPRDIGVMLYQPETGEHYIAGPLAFAVVRENGEGKRYWLDDQALISQLDNAGGYYNGFGDVLVYSIYVKDDRFIPGEVFFRKKSVLNSGYFLDDGDPLEGEWVDLTPADTEGWTKITSNYAKETLASAVVHVDVELPEEPDADQRPCVTFVTVIGSPNAPQIEAYMDALREQYPTEFAQSRSFNDMRRDRMEEQLKREPSETDLEEEDVTTAEEYRAALEEKLAALHTYMAEAPFRAVDSPELQIYSMGFKSWENLRCGSESVTFRGESWQLFHVEYFNAKEYFNQNYLVPAMIELVIGLVLVIIVPPVWALIAYLIYRRRYDLEAYRRSLTGALAHDLKTPLAVISGFAENLRTHTHPEKADAYADGIMENVQHIDTMIAGVLGLAELERSERPEMKEEIDVTALLHAAFARSELAMMMRGLTLKESGTWTVRGNADMLTQLADNLAANAIQHAKDNSVITVTAEGRTLRLSNPYEGELDAKTLCDPFQRGSAARGKQSGSGLGLSIVQHIAALHRVRMKITAENGIFTAELRSPR